MRINISARARGRRPIYRTAGVVLFLGLGGPLGWGQNAPGDDLAKLRADFERVAGAATRTLDERHRLNLQQWEAIRAEAGDYEGALHIKKRLEELARATTTAPIVAKPASYVLAPARAALREGALLDSSRGIIEFRRTGSKATWELLNLEPGVYEVRVTYATGLPDFSTRPRETNDPNGVTLSGALPGGVLGFGEFSTISNTTSGVQLQKRITTTGSWSNFITETLGKYDFRMRSPTVRLEALSATGVGLMHLKQVELVKSSADEDLELAIDPSPTSGNAIDAKVALENLRERYRAAERAALSRARLRISGELDRLERDLSSQGESVAAARVARERSQLFQENSRSEEPREPVQRLGR